MTMYVYVSVTPAVAIQSAMDANSKTVIRDFYHPACLSVSIHS